MIALVTEHTPTWLDVIIAVVVMIGGIGGPIGVTWINSRKIMNTVGTPNGKGNIVQMQEETLTHVATIATTLKSHIEIDQSFMDEMRTHVKNTDRRLDDLEAASRAS